jgi:hypothetical protein
MARIFEKPGPKGKRRDKLPCWCWLNDANQRQLPIHQFEFGMARKSGLLGEIWHSTLSIQTHKISACIPFTSFLSNWGNIPF